MAWRAFVPLACATVAAGALLLWLRRRRSVAQQPALLNDQPALIDQANAQEDEQRAAAALNEAQSAKHLVTIVLDSAVDSSTAIASLTEATLASVCNCERVDISKLNIDALQGGGQFIFLVELDREGEATAARPLTRALRPLRLAGSHALDHTHVAVLALAHSVCAFSAASGGPDKFRGAARLQSGLVDAGCTLIHAMGTAEVEIEEVEQSVLPWIQAIDGALQKSAVEARALGEMMRASESALKQKLR